jgi:sulfite exporter TauE/SafE
MDVIQTVMGATVAGLVTSVHCVGMCGPIACGLASAPKTEAGRLVAATAYHGARLTAYGMVGAACGLLGEQPLRRFFDSPAVLLPWVLAIVFLIFGLGLERKLPKPVSLLKFTARLRFKTVRMTPAASGLTLGFLTPLLPCGPLYLLFAACLLTGSGWRGAEFAIAFGMGTVPLLWLAQTQFHRLRSKVRPVTLARCQRGLAIVAALVVMWRLHGTLPFAADKTPTAELPSCCH